MTSATSGWLRWALAAAVLLPLTVLLHELAHFGVAHAFGFPDVMLYPTYVRDGAEAAGFPEWQRGVRALAGPLATWAMIAAGAVAARRHPGSVWAVTLGVIAPIRSALVAAGLLAASLLGRTLAATSLDEADAAQLLGLPAALPLAIGAAGALAAWWMVTGAIPPGKRRAVLSAVATGGAAGLGLYLALAAALERL